MIPTEGRIVLYRLSAFDCKAIHERRNSYSGRGVHEGNQPSVGDVCAMIVVKAWGESVNGQVFLDGNDNLWATSRHEGTEPGTWHWPGRV